MQYTRRRRRHWRAGGVCAALSRATGTAPHPSRSQKSRRWTRKTLRRRFSVRSASGGPMCWRSGSAGSLRSSGAGARGATCCASANSSHRHRSRPRSKRIWRAPAASPLRCTTAPPMTRERAPHAAAWKRYTNSPGACRRRDDSYVTNQLLLYFSFLRSRII